MRYASNDCLYLFQLKLRRQNTVKSCDAAKSRCTKKAKEAWKDWKQFKFQTHLHWRNVSILEDLQCESPTDRDQ